MKLKIALIAAVVSFTGVVACNSDQDSSDVKSIGTNLDTGKADGGPTSLYWVDGSSIKRGACDEDQAAVLHATCENEVEYMSWAAFKEDLDGGMSDTIASLEKKIVVIQKALKKVSYALKAAKSRLAEVEADRDATAEELASARDQMEYYEDIVFEYREQLAYIQAELDAMKNPDQDLVAMGAYVAEQLDAYRFELADIYNNVKTLTHQIEKLDYQIAGLKVLIVKLGKAFRTLSVELKNTQAELAVVRDMFAIYENTVSKLEHRIIFVIKDDTAWFEANRRFVGMFDDIFADSGKKF